MSNIKWYERPMRIFDLIPPSEDKYLKIDLTERSKKLSNLNFNAEHIEVMDIKEGCSGKVYFKTNYGIMSKDLLKEILTANRKNDIKNIIYVNVHWGAENLYKENPEWMQVTSDGKIVKSGYGVGSYFCVNSKFREWCIGIISDLAEYDIDGIFLDGPIFVEKACFCKSCTRKFKSKYGYDLNEDVFNDSEKFKDFISFKKSSLAQFVKDCNIALKEKKPESVIYMNSIQLNPDRYCSRDNNMTIKYQDMLGAEGGFLYTNLRDTPIYKPGMTAKLIESQADGKPTVVFIAGRWSPWTRTLLTGPESWIVHAEAAANGANTWYGIYSENTSDPMMENIKEINGFLKQNEKCFTGTRSLAKTAIVWSGNTANFYQSTAKKTDFTEEHDSDQDIYKSDMMSDFIGWYQMLSRNHIIFDIVDDYYVENKDISKYDTVILPNTSCMSIKESDKITDYVKNGGNLISTFDTSFYDEYGNIRKSPLLKDVMGIESINGTEKLNSDHIANIKGCIYTDNIDQTFIAAPELYIRMKASPLSKQYLKYKEKQPSVYCDVMKDTKYPLIVSNSYYKGKSVYINGNIGKCYYTYQIPEYKKIIMNVIKSIENPQVELIDCVDSIDLSYRTNGDFNILHVINFTGSMTRPIEKIVVLNDIKVRINEQDIKKVYDVKREKYIDVQSFDGYSEIVLPEVKEYEIFRIEK